MGAMPGVRAKTAKTTYPSAILLIKKLLFLVYSIDISIKDMKSGHFKERNIGDRVFS